jgi:hypothetical protein
MTENAGHIGQEQARRQDGQEPIPPHEDGSPSTLQSGVLPLSETTERGGSQRLQELVGAVEAVRDHFQGDNGAELIATLGTYLGLLDDFDRERAAAVQGGLGPGQDLGRDEDDEEPADQVRAPAIRGRVEDADDDEPRKRRTIDNLIRFRVGDDPSLPADLRQTLEAVEGFARDPGYAKARILRCPTRPDFPTTLWGDILTNSFVDLDKVFDFHYATAGAGKRTVHRTCGDWAIAWAKYKAAVQFVFPHPDRDRELAAYGSHIEDTFLANPSATDRVLKYDRRVRTRAAESARLLSDFHAFFTKYQYFTP